MQNRGAPNDEQVGQVEGYAATAARESGLNRRQLRAVLGRGDELKDSFLSAIRRLCPVNPHPERAEPERFCPPGFAMSPLETQAKRLQEVLGFEPRWPEAAQDLTLPDEADGLGLWPMLPTLGKLWGIIGVHESIGYGQVLRTVCDKINDSPGMAPLTNYRADKLKVDDVRIVAEVLAILAPLEDEAMRAGYNCLAMPINFGDWGTGYHCSPESALWQTLNLPPRCLAIEPVAGLSLVIGSPHILTEYGQQWKDFPGAMCNLEHGPPWSGSFCLRFHNGRLEFDAREAYSASRHYNSIVGFPEALKPAT